MKKTESCHKIRPLSNYKVFLTPKMFIKEEKGKENFFKFVFTKDRT